VAINGKKPRWADLDGLKVKECFTATPATQAVRASDEAADLFQQEHRFRINDL
jgi:hypothetical protein